MARLILSAGMFSALAAAMAVRRRGLVSGSPPFFAAILISLIRRVKILPRLASSAPFLCLIVAHFEWPDIGIPRVRLQRIVLIRDQDLPVSGDHVIASKPSRRKAIIARPQPSEIETGVASEALPPSAQPNRSNF